MGADIRVRRVYDEPTPEDGARVLVDRVWPRGMREDAARLDEWAKDVAPSAGLRTWYQHDPARPPSSPDCCGSPCSRAVPAGYRVPAAPGWRSPGSSRSVRLVTDCS